MPASNLPLLMTDMLPLRRVVDLPTYRADAASQHLPWVFGRATVNAIPLDVTGQEWLVADHPIVSIDRVTVAGKVTLGWQLQQRVDPTGKPISVLRLSQPVTSGGVAVTLTGRKHPTTGALLATAGGIVREIMRLCNHVEDPTAWSGLDENYGQVELGLVFTSPQPLRSAIASVIEPLYAVWRPGWAAPRQPVNPVMTLDVTNTETISARMDNTTLATVLRVTYGYDWSVGAARGTLKIAAPDAQERWGDTIVDVDLPAIRRARDALAFASARLVDNARTTWTVTADVDARAGQLLAGQTVALDHPHVPAGLALVTAVSHDRETAILKITATLRTESEPRVVMTQRNAAVDPATPATPTTTYRDGVATFTVLDEQGNPLANATVTLDTILTANTDASGIVQFKAARGPHTLYVTMDGYAPFELDVLV